VTQSGVSFRVIARRNMDGCIDSGKLTPQASDVGISFGEEGSDEHER
jgi:hypothetical protein